MVVAVAVALVQDDKFESVEYSNSAHNSNTSSIGVSLADRTDSTTFPVDFDKLALHSTRSR